MRRGPIVYAGPSGEGASVMVTSGFPLRVVYPVGQTYSYPVLLVFRDRALVLGASELLLVTVPSLLG